MNRRVLCCLLSGLVLDLLAAQLSSRSTLAAELQTTTASFYSPPLCGDTAPFGDVDPVSDFCPWIRQLKLDGISAGCGGGNYCPKNAVTREQLAVMLGKAIHDASSAPTIFSRFAGNGLASRVVNSGFENLGTVKAEYSSFIVAFGATLTIDQGAGYVGADYCEISGTITVLPGGLGNFGASTPEPGFGRTGANGAGGTASAASLNGCLGGKGGNGGTVAGMVGGPGGGAAGHANARAATAAAGFPTYLTCGGGGGGSGGSDGGTGADGGGGGGIFYLECNILFFSGTIEAKGGPGAPGEVDLGAGGGGGGGVVIIRSRFPQLTSGTTDVSGGLDGGLMNSGTAGSPGYSGWEVVP